MIYLNLILIFQYFFNRNFYQLIFFNFQILKSYEYFKDYF